MRVVTSLRRIAVDSINGFYAVSRRMYSSVIYQLPEKERGCNDGSDSDSTCTQLFRLRKERSGCTKIMWVKDTLRW